MSFEPKTLDPKHIPTLLFQKLQMSFQFSTPIRTENDTSRFPKEEVRRGDVERVETKTGSSLAFPQPGMGLGITTPSRPRS